MPTIHLLIKGKVQGVFYRASAKEKADELELKGWIRNTIEGHVEACVTGHSNIIAQFIEWCKKGPRKAVVEEVITNELEEQSFNEFAIIR